MTADKVLATLLIDFGDTRGMLTRDGEAKAPFPSGCDVL